MSASLGITNDIRCSNEDHDMSNAFHFTPIVAVGLPSYQRRDLTSLGSSPVILYSPRSSPIPCCIFVSVVSSDRSFVHCTAHTSNPCNPKQTDAKTFYHSLPFLLRAFCRPSSTYTGKTLPRSQSSSRPTPKITPTIQKCASLN